MNTTYQEFLESKRKSHTNSGFVIDENILHHSLFDFQRHCVAKSLYAGRYALLEDCGLGKSRQQLAWIDQVVQRTNKPGLILAPLGVTGQTIEEAKALDLDVARLGKRNSESKIYICNYEQLDNLDPSMFGSVVLDESGILKNYEAATKKKLVESFQRTPYKLCCTATPSPNDDMEICNHAEFLNHGRREEILAMYFTHDGGDTSKWRLKGHAKRTFWNFVKQWSLFVSNPSDLGFDGTKFVLPDLNLIERFVRTPTRQGMLFNEVNVNATDFNRELRNTMEYRLSEVAKIVEEKATDESILIWVKQNIEAEWITKNIPGFIEIRGTESAEAKEEKLLSFAKGDIKRIVTKSKIAGFGMNFQECHNQIDAAPDFSFESTYQKIRRSYRFGQKYPVNYYMIVTDSMQNVIESFKRKQVQFDQMKYYLTNN